jgi:CubicO group peptidase (beta-lactamase class C family)
MKRIACLVAPVLFLACLTLHAQLSPDLTARIDKAATDALARTGVPSASVAIVKDGRIAYVKAYGDAKLEPKTPASSSMRYSIGSISKQFTAAAMLLLQEQGKLSLDDKVAKFLPDLTRANEVTIRQVLSHTSGYQDYWPQDYVMPMMLKPVTSQTIMDRWAKIPLDFDPGTKWQYSNTNYVIAGAIIEKASGMPLWQFLQERIFKPLGMTTAYDIDRAKLTDSDPTGYIRFALGPLHPAPKEGPGWLFAAGEIAMTAEDLAKWDISIIDQKVLKPASYSQFGRDTLLNSGVSTRYGLGVSVGTSNGRRTLSHSGEVSGFTALNTIFPDDRTAIVVLTNQDASDGGGAITGAIAPMLFETVDATVAPKTEQARKIFEGLQKGAIDRSLFTDNANFYFSETALKDFADSLRPLGAPQSFTQVQQSLRGGMTLHVYIARFANNKTLRAWTFEMPDGKLEQFQVAEN